MQQIFVPKDLDEHSAKIVIQQIWQADHNQDIYLNLSCTRFALPFGVLVLANALTNHFQETGKPIILTGHQSSSAYSYLSHIGFFQLASFTIGNAPDVARGSSSYIPIRVLSRKQFDDTARDYFEDTGQTLPIAHFINNHSYKLARLFANYQNEQSIQLISYCLREIIRNVFEHSGASSCTVFGQKWANGRVEIAIADCGCGIYHTLARKYPLPTNRDALLKSIQPGVSGQIIENQFGEWSNSGYGLFVLSELGKRFGKFTICSGTDSLSGHSGQIFSSGHLYKGTAVQLRLNMHQHIISADIIEQICNEGTVYAFKQGYNTTASKRTILF